MKDLPNKLASSQTRKSYDSYEVELDNLGRNWFDISGYGMITISHSIMPIYRNNYFTARTFTPEMKAQYAQQ